MNVITMLIQFMGCSRQERLPPYQQKQKNPKQVLLTGVSKNETQRCYETRMQPLVTYCVILHACIHDARRGAGTPSMSARAPCPVAAVQRASCSTTSAPACCALAGSCEPRPPGPTSAARITCAHACACVHILYDPLHRRGPFLLHTHLTLHKHLQHVCAEQELVPGMVRSNR